MKTYRVIFKMIKQYPRYFIGNVLVNLIFFLLPLAVTLIIAEIFNILQGISISGIRINLLIWSIPFIFLIRVTAIIAAAIFGWSFGLSIQILLRRNMLNGLFDKPGAKALPASSGEAISRFRGDAETLSWFCNFIAIMISFATFGITAIILMFSINPMVTAVVLIPYIGLILLVLYLRNKMQEYQKQRRKDTAIVTSNIGEIFSSVQSIKATSSERNILNHFDKINVNRKQSSVKDSILSSTVRSLYQVTVSIATGILLLFVIQPIRSGDFTLGEFFIFTFLLGWLAGFLGNVAETIAWYQRSDVSKDRMAKLLVVDQENGYNNDLERETMLLVQNTVIYTKNDPPVIPAINRTLYESLKKLEIKNLSFSFKGNEEGIFDVSFSVKRNSFTVITGKVGAGKTTLLRTIQGLYTPQKGLIYWNGTEVEDPSKFFQTPISAYTPQEPRLFSESIKDNLLMGLPESSVEISKALKLAVVENDIDKFENNIDTVIGPKGVKLSGGQKQRVAAARMFVREPEILFMDDISSALDVETEKILWERVFGFTDSTVIAVSHRKSVLEQADQVILMDEGKIKAIGPLNELLDQHREIRELYYDGKFQ